MFPRFKLTLTGFCNRWLRPHSRAILGFAILTLGVSLFWHGGTASADTPVVTAPLTPGWIMWTINGILLSISRLFLSLAVFMLTFIIEIASYNGYLSSTAVQIGWVMIRDITNMFFVVILLVIAFGTILGLEQYEWKKLLVKFVLAAILVNFSRIICGVVIDVAQVVMITFVNGIAATAGGNLINAFSLGEIQQLSPGSSEITDNTVFIAAVGAITFSAIVMAMMGVFLFMLIARMVVLWVLIVLSPLAFVLSVVPETQKYASEWWSEFGANVITGPVLLFFIWLSFVTVGGGNIHDEIQKDIPTNYQMNTAGAQTLASGDSGASSGVSKAMSWNSMANFAIAIGMLLVGAKAAQQMGGVGGAWAGGAVDFGKKVAMVASGVAAARWAGEKAKDGAKLAGKGLYVATLQNPVDRLKMLAERQLEGYRSWRAQGPRVKMKALHEKGKHEDLTEQELDAGVTVDDKGFKIDANGNRIQARDEKTGDLRYEFDRDKEGNLQFESSEEDSRSWLQKQLFARHEALVKSKKLLEKVTKQKTVREELMDKRVTANPKYFMQQFEGPQTDALDRVEQGQVEAEKARSAAKTEEFSSLGKNLVLENFRFKDGKFQTDKDKLADQIAKHKVEAEATLAKQKKVEAEAKQEYAQGKGGKAISAAVAAEKQAHSAAQEIEVLKKKAEEKYLTGTHEGQHEIAREEEIKVLLATNAEIIKRLETDARLKLILKKSAEGGALTDYERLLKAQAEGKLRSATLQSAEEENLYKTSSAILDEAIKADKEANILENRARTEFTTPDGTAARNEAQTLRKEVAKIAAISQKLKNDRLGDRGEVLGRVAAATDEAERQKLQAELRDFDNETDRLVREFDQTRGAEVNRLTMLADGLEEKADSIDETLLSGDQKEKKNNMLAAADKKRASSLGWEYGVAKAKAVAGSKIYGNRHATVLSDSDQRTIWKVRGVDTPTTAGTEQIEAERKEFAAMSYNQFVNNVTKHMKTMISDRAAGKEPDEATRLSTMSMVRHGIDKGWIDDMIISTMLDSVTNKAAREKFGWKNDNYDRKKINLLIAALATSGMNFKFAEQHDAIGDILDVGVLDKSLSVAEVYQGISTGNFRNDEMTEQIKKAVDPAKWSKIVGKAQEFEEYKKVIRDNAAAFQYVGSLRDELVESSHPENGAGAANHDIGGGESLDIPVGPRMQVKDWLGEDNKTPLQIRIKQHPHATAAEMTERFGTVVLERDENAFRIIRNGSNDVRSRSGTSPRFVNTAGGLSAREDRSDYIEKRGDKAYRVIGGRNKKTGEMSDLFQATIASHPEEFDEDSILTDADDLLIKELAAGQSITPAEAQNRVRRGRVVSRAVEKDFARQIRGNAADWLMNMAELSGTDANEARKGVMSDIFTDYKGNEIKVNNINDLINAYNNGAFSPGGKRPSSTLRKI